VAASNFAASGSCAAAAVPRATTKIASADTETKFFIFARSAVATPVHNHNLKSRQVRINRRAVVARERPFFISPFDGPAKLRGRRFFDWLLETRSNDEQTGTRVEIAGGKILTCDEIARTAGATISVRDLFFNVPARKKFLRSEQTELAHVASLVTHYSLAHPDKTFELWNGGVNLPHATPVATLRERVFQIFGSQLLDDIIELADHRKTLQMPEPDEPPREFVLHGFVSRPQVQKNNRNSIYVFVNGRLIRDRLILHALSAAYHNLMPAACFPFALLFLECDCEEVDVNVHPSKTEVRFRHQSWVHDFVRDAIREQLMQSRAAPYLSTDANSGKARSNALLGPPANKRKRPTTNP
jgi:DNA mismatch repair protein MutL